MKFSGEHLGMSSSPAPKPNKKQRISWAPMAHACNHSYSGSRDQEDCSSKPAQANSSARLYLEKPFTKIGLVEWLKV
jgi:hypothetical protein